MLPFWASIVVLSALQALIVALPDGKAIASVSERLLGREPMRSRTSASWWARTWGHWWCRTSSRWWALVPPGSIAAFVAVGAVASNASAQALTYLALWGVPVGASLALGMLGRASRPAFAFAVLPLMALAWADRAGLAGQAAAVALSALSCVALGALFAALTPPRWLMAGIVAMALVDAALVASELLQKPNQVLNSTHPAAGLPQLQAALFGSAAMGYGDLFVAGLLGGVLALTGSALRQRRVAILLAALAPAFDLLFFVVSELPATVPVALALVLVLLFERSVGGDVVSGGEAATGREVIPGREAVTSREPVPARDPIPGQDAIPAGTRPTA